MEDMDIDGLDIQWSNIKPKEKDNSNLELQLNRNVSFGPIKHNHMPPQKTLSSKEKYEEEKDIGKFNQRPTSIASFLQNSLKTVPPTNFLEIDSKRPSLFASKSNDQSIEHTVRVKPLKTILERERWMDRQDLESLDLDEDEMDIDDIPELSLK